MSLGYDLAMQLQVPSMRVVLVDADPDTREMYASHLDVRQITVYLAGDATEGFRLAERHQPDAVVTELHLPKISGLSLARAMKAHPPTSAIPVLLLTGDARRDIAIAAQAAGCAALCRKPCDPVALYDVMVAMLRRWQSGAASSPAPSVEWHMASAHTGDSAERTGLRQPTVHPPSPFAALVKPVRLLRSGGRRP